MNIMIMIMMLISCANSCLYLQPISNADFIVPVEIDGTIHQVYVLKRPYVDEYLQKMGELYECVLFTASLAKVRLAFTDHVNCLLTCSLFVSQYADPVADLLDKWGVFRARLFRESCVFYRGNYVKVRNTLNPGMLTLLFYFLLIFIRNVLKCPHTAVSPRVLQCF